jgi:outer membrane lipoprotein-sorting protein
MHRIIRLAAVALLLVIVISVGFAQSPSGEDIMRQVFTRPQPRDVSGSLTMTLENARGDRRVRSVNQYVADFGDAEKKLLVFAAPADVRDTAFMNWSYADPGRPDDQWIYLPALRSVRRISAERRNDSFMGSDFTYDDLSERHPDMDTHRLEATETIDGRTVYVVESVPLDASSAYGRTRSWIADGIWIGLRREFYDRAGEHIKTLTVEEYRQIDGFWTIERMVMKNEVSGHSTTMELSDLRLDTGLSENLFTERTMTRGVR